MKRTSVDQPDLFAWAAEASGQRSDEGNCSGCDPAPPAPPHSRLVEEYFERMRAASASAPCQPAPRYPAPGPVVDFLARRPTLPRWILGGRRDLKAFDLWYGRKTGDIPPAPIITFPQKHPASPGSYSPAPTRRQG